MADKMQVLRNAYQKLDGMPLGFGVRAYSADMSDTDVEKVLGIDYLDTMRETRLSINDVETGSIDEMYLENRIVYHTIKRFRLTSSIYFKFSTAVDGKTVDKTSIPKIIASILAEYDAEYKKWRSGSTSSILSRSSSLNWTPNNSGGYSS